MPRVSIVSIIIPIFNREEFLPDAIDSVLEQDAGLDRVQIVLVDDGSVDGSAAICDRYASEYPETVVTVHQENQGVAAAFNTGLSHVTGEVVGFLGSDDTLSENTVSEVIDFYEAHWEQCDLAAIKIEMFGSRGGPHWNNRKRFARTAVIDVTTSWNQPQVHGGGTFIKTLMFHELGHSFDPALFITEDATLNTQIIMKKLAYGVLSSPTYYNRRYDEGGASQVSSSHFRREFYDQIVKFAYQRILDDARRLHGEVPLYVQAVVCYDIAFRFRGSTEILDEIEREAYRERLAHLLRQVSVLAIMSTSAHIEQRFNMLDLREERRLGERIRLRNGLATLEGVRVYSFDPAKSARHRPPRCELYSVRLDEDSVELVGALFAVRLRDEMSFAIRNGRELHELELEAPFRTPRPTLHDAYTTGHVFRIRVPYAPGDTLHVVVCGAGRGRKDGEHALALRLGRASGLAGSSKVEGFRRDGDDVLHQIGATGLRRRRLHSALGAARTEAGFIRRMHRAGLPSRLVTLRLRALAARRRKKYQQIWLMADHKLDAGDNAEALFRHLCAHPELGIYPVLALSARASGHRELAALGEVVEPDSTRFLQRFFQADVFLNSAADEYMINPLAGDRFYVQDLIPPISVFLQHGVTKDDQSDWLNWPRKGFDMVVTSAEREQRSFIDGDYGYLPEQIPLVGMPRLDRLESAPERLLVLAPTWRKNLVGALDETEGRNELGDAFENSEYRRRWQAIIEHPRLDAALQQHGYRGVFAIHPSHAAEASCFRGTDRMSISEPPHDYRALFRSGSILATDYSSVAFDFAYLRKPVVYFQPDREEFYAGHLYSEGYYSYDDDGFGPVATDVESFVTAVVERLQTQGELEQVYRDRIDTFFAFEGGGNSQRLCEAVVEAQRRKGLRD
ncbi:glycosyltransferase [Brachybacterium sp.]|uniref:glycosyltransferase n=1 Tax=Brachybacterium sp. TaxID=1891286 RepID=UPI003F9175EE